MTAQTWPPTSLSGDVGRFRPADIGSVVMSARYHGSDTFIPWTGLALLANYAALALPKTPFTR